MFKVLSFLDNQISHIETELNQYKGWTVAATWPMHNKLVIILQKKEAGRPKKELEAVEE